MPACLAPQRLPHPGISPRDASRARGTEPPLGSFNFCPALRNRNDGNAGRDRHAEVVARDLKVRRCAADFLRRLARHSLIFEGWLCRATQIENLNPGVMEARNKLGGLCHECVSNSLGVAVYECVSLSLDQFEMLSYLGKS